MLRAVQQRHHYPDEFERAIALDYFDSLTPDQFEELDELPEDLLGMVHLNAFEWVLAEGEIGLTEDEDDIVPVMELVLGEGGPLMEANERRYLQLLATEPIDLYEVVEAEPGEGLWLVSTLAHEPKRVWVRERSASRSLREGDIFAARVLPCEPSVLSGAVYAFNRPQYLELRGALLHGPEQIADLPVPVAESPGAVRIGHPERSHLVEYLAPNSVFNSLPRQRSSPHLRPDDRLVTIDRVLHHASLGVA